MFIWCLHRSSEDEQGCVKSHHVPFLCIICSFLWIVGISWTVVAPRGRLNKTAHRWGVQTFNHCHFFFQKHFPRQLELTVLTEKYSTELCELWDFIPHVFSFCLSFFPPVRYLLRNNVSPDLCNEDGLTALHQVRPTLWQGTEILWSLRQEYEERFQTIICSKDIEWS